MKIFSTEFSKHSDRMRAKSIIVEKKGSKLSLLKHYNTDAENIQHLSKNLPVNIGIDYYDYIDETLNLPPVKEYKTFRTLAMNKLKDTLETDTDYLLVYKRNTYAQADSTGNFPYRVFLAPSEIFYGQSAITETVKNHIDMFTLTDFALCALTVNYFPDKMVFHAYADGSKICVTVSQGDVILYTRSNIISDDIKDRMNSYYEYLNLTFMFVTKNMRITPEHVILSGALTDMPELAAMFFEFSNIPQATLTPWTVISNCSYELFQQNIIPISLCLLDSAYSFTPKEVVKEQAKRSLLFFANSAACIAVVLMLFTVLLASLRLSDAKNTMELQTSVLKNKMKAYSAAVQEITPKKYDMNYYNLMKSAQNDPIKLYPDFAELIDMTSPETVAFEKDSDGRPKITVTGKLQFKSLPEAESITNAVKSFLTSGAITSKYTVKDSNSYNMSSMTASLNMEFTSGAGQ